MPTNYNFSTWLIQQSGRADSIGDLARFISGASDAPLGAYRHAPWRKYLNTRNAPKHLVDAVDLAFDEWIAKFRRF